MNWEKSNIFIFFFVLCQRKEKLKTTSHEYFIANLSICLSFTLQSPYSAFNNGSHEKIKVISRIKIRRNQWRCVGKLRESNFVDQKLFWILTVENFSFWKFFSRPRHLKNSHLCVPICTEPHQTAPNCTELHQTAPERYVSV